MIGSLRMRHRGVEMAMHSVLRGCYCKAFNPRMLVINDKSVSL